MIVCSCNVISDHDIRAAAAAGPSRSRSVDEIHGCMGCSVQCGRCSRSIKRIVGETLGVRASGGSASVLAAE